MSRFPGRAVPRPAGTDRRKPPRQIRRPLQTPIPPRPPRPRERLGVVLWPGLEGAQSASYTCSHGIKPNGAIIIAQPQQRLPQEHGTLVIGDGFNFVALRNAKIDSVQEIRDADGQKWVITILDRRWAWTFGRLEGAYNVPDSAGDVTRLPENAAPTLRFPTQYVPWTIRSARNLIEACLLEMGETRYVINVPAITDPLPTVNWRGTNPAAELMRLADTFGCRVVYDPVTDRVIVGPQGVGANLPDGSISSESPGLNPPLAPSRILIRGAPLEFQVRLKLEAAGREWNGAIKPLNDLSYAPDVDVNQKPKIIEIEPSDVTIGAVFTTTIDNQEFVSDATTLPTVANACEKITDSLANLAGYNVVNNVTDVQVTGPGVLDFDAAVEAQNAKARWAVLQLAVPPDSKWRFSPPPFHGDVQATDRLTRAQALALAQESVWKWYRILAVDPFDGRWPMTLPGFGALLRREQLVIKDEQIVHVTPEKADENITDGQGLPVIRDFYDGLARRKPARCYGSYSRGLTAPIGLMDTRLGQDVNGNTDADAEVYVPFEIDAPRYLVRFSSPIYRLLNQSLEPANLALQTTVNVRNASTNQLEHYIRTYNIGGNRATTARRRQSPRRGLSIRHDVRSVRQRPTPTRD